MSKTCKGITMAGKSCKRPSQINGYCITHFEFERRKKEREKEKKRLKKMTDEERYPYFYGKKPPRDDSKHSESRK